MMRFTDVHLHLDLVPGCLPDEITAARIGWPLAKLQKAVKWYSRFPWVVHFLLWLYNLAARDLHIRAFLALYGAKNPVDKAMRELKAAGIHEAFALAVPYGRRETDDLTRNHKRNAILMEAALRGVFVFWPGYKGNPAYLQKLYPAVKGTATIYEAAAAGARCVIVHTSGGGIGEDPDASHPKHGRRALEDFPDLIIIYAHAGGGRSSWLDEIEFQILEYRDEEGRPRVFTEPAFHDYTAPGYFPQLKERIERAPDAWLWGSDYPLCTLRDGPYKNRVEAYRKGLGEWYFELLAGHNPAALRERIVKGATKEGRLP